ncbi:TraB/GumN family protein [Lysobacter sp. A3-1-A15]|uniref:TraB/GumN family protein n=1 Tax=Novilysobacter viscosus TaxID=3098602 RepID=UPI002EDB4522
MRRLSRLALAASLALALLAPASARPDSETAPVASASATVGEHVHTAPVPLLWKLSDADNSVYLLGSFHLLKPDDYPVSTDVDAAFNAADRLVFEVAPEDLHDPSTALKFLQAAGYGDGGSLSEVLPQDMREKFDRILAGNGASIAQFEAYEPWFVNLSLTLGLSQSMGFSGEHGLDQYLMRAAADAGKPTAGLESIDDQLGALDNTPMDEQVASLSDFIERPEAMPGMLADLHTAWRNGDIPELDRMTREEMQAQTPETYRLVNVARNQAWLPRIRALLDDSASEDVLVVVGALHLLGEDGLVEQLADEGYVMERVCSACAAGDSMQTAER